MNQAKQITAMASIMIAARQANEDVGELIAVSLQNAATQLGDVGMLVRGRPGSWEADILLRMANEGGSDANKERVEKLAALFVHLGDAGVDGGDMMSQAMSEAVDSLGGLDQFSGGSQWHWDLTNMCRQYSTHWND